MKRLLPSIVAVLGYLALLAGATAVDLRAGVMAFGLCLLYEAREAER